MDFYTALFWVGFLILIFIHVKMNNREAVIPLLATLAMFLGSKIGREFLGIK